MSDKRVVWANPDGSVSVLIPAPGVSEKVWVKDVPEGADAKVVDVSDIPQDRLFRAAWKLDGSKCVEDVDKCREVAHQRRRERRSAEFAPHDDAIAKAIPGQREAAEEQRQLIREKYDRVQADIDACATPEDMRRALKAYNAA